MMTDLPQCGRYKAVRGCFQLISQQKLIFTEAPETILAAPRSCGGISTNEIAFPTIILSMGSLSGFPFRAHRGESGESGDGQFIKTASLI